MNIQPLEDRVVIKPIEAATSQGSIIIPDTAKEKPIEGEVVAVGPGSSFVTPAATIVFIPVDLNVGDKVLYSKYVGVEVTHGGEDFIIMKGSEVLAKLDPEE